MEVDKGDHPRSKDICILRKKHCVMTVNDSEEKKANWNQSLTGVLDTFILIPLHLCTLHMYALCMQYYTCGYSEA